MESTSATLLYVQACKFLMYGEDRSSWDQLMVILPRLRNALTCRVCRGLLVDPLSSRYCQHYVCRACLKRKRAPIPGCKWCLDWSKLQRSDGQIRVLLACYKLLCEAIKSSNYYVNGGKNLNIDKLLNEAKLNTDVSPNSSVIFSNNSRILDSPNMAKMAAEVVSRDQLKTCARENVTNDVNTNDGGKFNFDAMKIQETITNEISEPCDEKSFDCLTPSVTTVNENNDQEQPEAIKETDDTNASCNDMSMSCSVTDINDINCSSKVQTDSDTKDGVNNNEIKTSFVRKVKSKNKRACLRPRNGQLVQRFEAGRYMRKRKLLPGDKIVKKNNKQMLHRSTDQKNRPRKKCRIE